MSCGLYFVENSENSREEKISLKQKHREYSYSEVVSITNSFRDIIGEGGFGKVYKGVLKDKTLVAVKLLSSTSKQGYREFQTEVINNICFKQLLNIFFLFFQFWLNSYDNALGGTLNDCSSQKLGFSCWILRRG